MKNDNIFKVINNIDEELIADSEKVEIVHKKSKVGLYATVAVAVAAASILFAVTLDRHDESYDEQIVQNNTTEAETVDEENDVMIAYSNGKLEGLFLEDESYEIKKERHVDLSQIDDYYVAQFPEEIIKEHMDFFAEEYQKSPYIVKVIITEDFKPDFGEVKYKAKIIKAYEGNLCVGDEISIGREGTNCYLYNSNLYMELGFHNILKAGEEYLFFCKEYDEKTNTLYMEGYSFPGFFLCEDRESVVAGENSSYGTYVKYNQVKENEFFVTSEETLRLIKELKKSMLEKYK